MIGSAHVDRDGEFDPWGALAGLDGHGVAVRVRDGRATFVFADDVQSRVEGPGGTLSLDSLIEERWVSSDALEIAMEPGLIYRTRRAGMTVTAEIVARPERLAPPPRARAVVAMLGLCAAAIAMGSTALAAAEDDNAQLESVTAQAHADDLAAMLAREAQRDGGLVERPTPARTHWPEASRGVFVAFCGCGRLDVDQFPALETPYFDDHPPASWPEWVRPWPAVAIRPSRVEIEGNVSERSVRHVVRHNLRDIEGCDRYAGRHWMPGRIDVRFVVGGDGTVLGAAVIEDSTTAPLVGRCIANTIRRMDFDTPRDGGIARADYTFTITPREPRRARTGHYAR